MPLLAVSSATSLTENSVRVTYDAAVQFSGTWEPGDAGDPKNYEITAAGLTYEVSSVAAVEGSTTSVDLFLREVLPADGTLTVTGVRSAGGDELGGSNTATIRALPYRQPALVDAVAGGVRDIANVNGVWFIDRGGDFTTDVGLVQLRKRLFRRLSTPKNAISHLPGYGVNVAAYIKQLASASARTRLIADIEQQFSQEPEVLSTSATLTQFGNRGLWRLRVLVRTRFGTTLRPEYDVGVLGNEPWTFPVEQTPVINNVYQPANLALTSWFRASYGGSPWTGTSSAGISGLHNVSEGTNFPAVGALVNGLAPADFDGTNDILAYAVNNTTFFGTTGTVWYLFYADAAPADPGTVYARGNVLTDPVNAETTFGFTSLGITATIYDGAYKSHTIACGAGAWHLAQWKWNGTKLRGRVDGGAWTEVACGNYTSGTPSPLRMGSSYVNTVRFDGRILDLATTNFALTDTDFDGVLAYARDRYNLALP